MTSARARRCQPSRPLGGHDRWSRGSGRPPRTAAQGRGDTLPLESPGGRRHTRRRLQAVFQHVEVSRGVTREQRSHGHCGPLLWPSSDDSGSSERQSHGSLPRILHSKQDSSKRTRTQDMFLVSSHPPSAHMWPRGVCPRDLHKLHTHICTHKRAPFIVEEPRKFLTHVYSVPPPPSLIPRLLAQPPPPHRQHALGARGEGPSPLFVPRPRLPTPPTPSTVPSELVRLGCGAGPPPPSTALSGVDPGRGGGAGLGDQAN